MSFGSENPELWDEICKRGITNKVAALAEKDGVDDIDDYTVETIVHSLYEVTKIRNALLDWAHDEVCNSEADHWGSKIDEAVMRHEDHQMSMVWAKSGDIKEEQPC
jgi:hypothetical protein